jgi:ribosomal protein S27AE
MFEDWPGLSAIRMAGDNKRQTSTLVERLDELESRLEHQAVFLQAICKLLVERSGISEEELKAFIKNTEAERLSAQNRKCLNCGNFLPRRKNRCLYCGKDQLPQSIGETI